MEAPRLPVGGGPGTRSTTMADQSNGTAAADAAALRARARALRALARRVDESVLGELLRAGGDDTWRGPTPSAFQADARRADRWRQDAVASLRRAAGMLEARAAELDRLALR